MVTLLLVQVFMVVSIEVDWRWVKSPRFGMSLPQPHFRNRWKRLLIQPSIEERC